MFLRSYKDALGATKLPPVGSVRSWPFASGRSRFRFLQRHTFGALAGATNVGALARTANVGALAGAANVGALAGAANVNVTPHEASTSSFGRGRLKLRGPPPTHAAELLFESPQMCLYLKAPQPPPHHREIDRLSHRKAHRRPFVDRNITPPPHASYSKSGVPPLVYQAPVSIMPRTDYNGFEQPPIAVDALSAPFLDPRQQVQLPLPPPQREGQAAPRKFMSDRNTFRSPPASRLNDRSRGTFATSSHRQSRSSRPAAARVYPGREVSQGATRRVPQASPRDSHGASSASSRDVPGTRDGKPRDLFRTRYRNSRDLPDYVSHQSRPAAPPEDAVDPRERVLNAAIARGFVERSQVLLLRYAAYGALDKVIKLLESMEKKGALVPAPIFVNLASVFSQAGYLNQCVEFAQYCTRIVESGDFRLFRRNENLRDIYTVLIAAFCHANDGPNAERSFLYLARSLGVQPTADCLYPLVSLYAKSTCVMDLVRLFTIIDSCGVTVDQHFYDLLLSGLTKSGHVDRAVGYIRRAHKKGLYIGSNFAKLPPMHLTNARVGGPGQVVSHAPQRQRQDSDASFGMLYVLARSAMETEGDPQKAAAEIRQRLAELSQYHSPEAIVDVLSNLQTLGITVSKEMSLIPVIALLRQFNTWKTSVPALLRVTEQHLGPYDAKFFNMVIREAGRVSTSFVLNVWNLMVKVFNVQPDAETLSLLLPRVHIITHSRSHPQRDVFERFLLTTYFDAALAIDPPPVEMHSPLQRLLRLAVRREDLKTAVQVYHHMRHHHIHIQWSAASGLMGLIAKVKTQRYSTSSAYDSVFEDIKASQRLSKEEKQHLGRSSENVAYKNNAPGESGT